MEALIQDLRFAARQIRRNPGFAAVSIITLALGIGANAAIFSVVNGLLLRPLPYHEPDRLVEINHHYPSLDGLEASISAAGLRNYQDNLPSLESVAAQTGWGVNLTGDGEPERLTGARLSGNYFETYGESAALGRLFGVVEDSPGNDRVVVLSDGLWRRRFGADPDIVGRTITVNSEPYVVLGVLRRGFRPFFSRDAEIFSPLALTEQQYAAGYTNEYLSATARLAEGVPLERAQTETTALAEQLKSGSPGFPQDWGIRLTTLNERARGQIRPALFVLLGAVAFVLLIACANVANLLLARGAVRAREMVMRLAVGGRRRHLVRQLLVESLVLSSIGGAIGLALAWATVRVVRQAAASSVPRIDQIGIDPLVIAFIAVLVLVTAVLFGLAPALSSAGADLQEALREGSRGATGSRSGLMRRVLVVTEFALSLTLLAGAGLLVKSFARLTAVDPGFAAERLLTFNVALPSARYPSDTTRIQFFDRLLPELAATPGVEAVAATSVLPFSGSWSTGSFQVEGFQPAAGQPGPWGDIRVVNAGFASAMGIPLRQGRFLAETDDAGGPGVVVVDEEMMRRYWSDENPIGKRISFDNGQNWISVVGVVGHASHEGLDADARVQLYFPYKRNGPGSMFIALRTRGDPEALLPAVRAAVGAIDADQPISRVATMEQLMADTVGPRRLAAVLLAVFAGVALVLAATGVYGVISFNVGQRTRELGLRMAIGAGRGDVLRLVMSQGLKLAGLGVLFGVLGALGLMRVLSGQLYDVRPTDPPTLALVAGVLVVVAVVSTLLPALRATGVDPSIALRED